MNAARAGAAVLTVTLGVLACLALARAVSRPGPGRVALATAAIAAHCGWAVAVITETNR